MTRSRLAFSAPTCGGVLRQTRLARECRANEDWSPRSERRPGRYSVLYLYGGVYADVDVVAKPQMVELLNANPNRRCSEVEPW